MFVSLMQITREYNNLEVGIPDKYWLVTTKPS